MATTSTSKPTKRVNYLNNRDILKEIHKSKSTYCYFTDPSYAAYDLIIDAPESSISFALEYAMKPEQIQAAKIARAARLSQELGEKILPDSILTEDLIFRVMTWDHIPVSQKQPKKSNKKKTAKDIIVFEEDDEEDFSDLEDKSTKAEVDDMVHVKVNFPPFQHFKLDETNTFRCVGKSHWVDGLENGHFSKDHGNITNKLARMYMMLCEKYAMKFNWRGYCVDDTTETLTQRGWLSHSELNEDDQIMSYADGNLVWSSVKSIYRGDYDGDMFRMTTTGFDALVTPNHKWITDNGLKPIDYLLEKDRLLLMGDAVEGNNDLTYSDSFVELVGWFSTEGSSWQPKDRDSLRVSIYQNEGFYAERIRECLNALGEKYSESRKENNIRFMLSSKLGKKVLSVLGKEKSLLPEFLMKLSTDQRQLLLNTMLDGDGWRTTQNKSQKRGYCQKSKIHVDSFVMLCSLLGIRTSVKCRNILSYGKPTNIYNVTLFSQRRNVTMFENVNLHGGKRKAISGNKADNPHVPTEYYKGVVWCPETEFGCFLARRNGYVYLTGNTYNDEMKASAVLQLTYVGLRFNEAKSSNPFAYYTAAITNSFCRVLNTEKRAQNIRDDILEMNGLNPSFSRQMKEAKTNLLD